MEKASESNFTWLETKVLCCEKVISPSCDFEYYIVESIQKILDINICIIKACI